jgi:hypothetical protein
MPRGCKSQCSFSPAAETWILVLILLVSGGAAKAQSGRRTQTPPAAPSISGAKPVTKTEPAPQRISLFISIEDRNPFANIPYYLSDTVLDSCVGRLREASGVGVSASGRGLARTDAIHRAKSEKEIYVVWLQLESDLAGSRKSGKSSPGDLYLRYTIFEPGTAKIKAEGRTHQQIYRTGRGGVLGPTSSRNTPIYSEYALKQAAREAAQHVLEAFNIEVATDERGPR